MATAFEDFFLAMGEQVRLINAREDTAEQELVSIYIAMEAAIRDSFLTDIPTFTSTGFTEQNRVLMEEALTVLDTVIADFLLTQSSPGVLWVALNSRNMTAFGAERIAQTLDAFQRFEPAGIGRLQAIFENPELEQAAINAARTRLGSSALQSPARDMIEFMREVFTDGLVRGRPVVGRNSIAQQLFLGDRIQDLTVQTTSGQVRMISSEVRARTIARTELNRIENRAARSRAQALGLEKVYVSNPSDNRTSEICLRAVADGSMTVEQLEERHGFSPRHPNCRSRDVYFRESWAQSAGFTPGALGAENATARLNLREAG